MEWKFVGFFALFVMLVFVAFDKIDEAAVNHAEHEIRKSCLESHEVTLQGQPFRCVPLNDPETLAEARDRKVDNCEIFLARNEGRLSR